MFSFNSSALFTQNPAVAQAASGEALAELLLLIATEMPDLCMPQLTILACNSGAVGDEKHMIFECAAIAPLRQQHADLFTPRTDTMRSFFAQQDHLGVLNYVIL